MTIYCKLNKETNEIILPPVEKDGIINYNLDIDRLIQDGYKVLVEIAPPETYRNYHIVYVETSTEIRETIHWDETQEEADERVAREEKQQKINEINEKISELETMIISEIRLNNKSNIQIYNDIIKGLEDTRTNIEV